MERSREKSGNGIALHYNYDDDDHNYNDVIRFTLVTMIFRFLLHDTVAPYIMMRLKCYDIIG